MKTNPQTPRR